MSIFIGPMMKHLKGHKNQTYKKDIIEHNSANVCIPLAHANAEIQTIVNIGDKVKIGDIIAKRDDRFYVPIFSSVSGEVVAIEKKMTSSLLPKDHIVIKNDFLDAKNDSYRLDDNASRDEIVDYMKEIGLLGQGGAGFPSYIKYSTDKCESLIVNAVECEPYITSDAKNIEANPELFKQGVKFAIKASMCKICYIAIKAYKKKEIETLKELFNDIDNVVVCPVKDAYPMGWERTLVYTVLKKRYKVLPIEVGAIVSNATSLIELARSAKTGVPTYEKIVTVSGDAIKDPHNIKCRIGTSFKELVDDCGGYTADTVCLIAGGPMMGKTVTKDEVTTTSITNAVTVLKYKEIESLDCLKCGTCIEHCPTGLQPCRIVLAHKAKNMELLKKLKASDCVECGMCSYVCPSKIEVTELVRRAKKYMLASK